MADHADPEIPGWNRKNAKYQPLPQLISKLLDPDIYPDAASSPIALIETHISWVLLAGEYAYKIKKPVHFDYVNFSTLQRRKSLCEAELAINQQFAPSIYLTVVPITGPETAPRIQGHGEIIEYAIKMKRFNSSEVFDHLLERQQISTPLIEKLADRVANLHSNATPCYQDQASHHVRAQFALVKNNFSSLHARLTGTESRSCLQPLEDWSMQQFMRLRRVQLIRCQHGFVRECHGDLHLGNIALYDRQPVLFDAIEFSDNLRKIDTMSEVAFLMMDLEVHHAANLSYRFLNRYLTRTGDYEGLKLLDYYRVYRAMVRAKITLEPLSSTTATPMPSPCAETQAQRFIAYGLELVSKKKPALIITRGHSGSGKTSLSQELSAQARVIHVSSDVERKRIAGIPTRSLQPACASTSTALEIYGPEHTLKTYQRLLAIADMLLEAGHSVVLDATFLKLQHRRSAMLTAKKLGAHFVIVDLKAPKAVLVQRIRQRLEQQKGFSDADLAVLDLQTENEEPLASDELRHTLSLNVTNGIDMAELMAGLCARTGQSVQSVEYDHD